MKISKLTEKTLVYLIIYGLVVLIGTYLKNDFVLNCSSLKFVLCFCFCFVFTLIACFICFDWIKPRR